MKRHIFIAVQGLITMDDYDCDYDYRNFCIRLQSIKIVIVISPKPDVNINIFDLYFLLSIHMFCLYTLIMVSTM